MERCNFVSPRRVFDSTKTVTGTLIGYAGKPTDHVDILGSEIGQVVMLQPQPIDEVWAGPNSRQRQKLTLALAAGTTVLVAVAVVALVGVLAVAKSPHPAADK